MKKLIIVICVALVAAASSGFYLSDSEDYVGGVIEALEEHEREILGETGGYADEEDEYYATFEDTDTGISVGIPEYAYENLYVDAYYADPDEVSLSNPPIYALQVIFMPPTLVEPTLELIDDPEITDEEYLEAVDYLYRSSILLFGVYVYDEDEWDEWMDDGTEPGAITQDPEAYEIGRQDGMVYVYTEQGEIDAGFSGEDQEAYEHMLAEVPGMCERVEMIPVEEYGWDEETTVAE